MELKAFIVDDEQNAVRLLESKLSKFQDIDIVGSANSVSEAEKSISKLDFDLLFLDVELTDGTGFDLLSKLEKIGFYVVFTTAYNRYAIDAFKVHAVDYLLKPINQNDLEFAINSVRMRRDDNKDNLGSAINDLINAQTGILKIPIRTKGKITLLDAKKIDYIKAHGQYSEVISNSKSFITSSHLGYYESLSPRLVRIHRSYILNLDKVEEILLSEQMVKLSNGQSIPFSASSKQELMEKLGL